MALSVSSFLFSPLFFYFYPFSFLSVFLSFPFLFFPFLSSPSLPLPSHPFSFSSLPFPSLPFPSLPFPPLSSPLPAALSLSLARRRGAGRRGEGRRGKAGEAGKKHHYGAIFNKVLLRMEEEFLFQLHARSLWNASVVSTDISTAIIVFLWCNPVFIFLSKLYVCMCVCMNRVI